MTDVGKGAVLLSQNEPLCPKPKTLVPKWEVLGSHLCCTINTVPQFPHLLTEQREQADFHHLGLLQMSNSSGKGKQAGSWNLEPPPQTSQGRKASLRATASWTRLSSSSWSAKAWQSPPLWPQTPRHRACRNILKEQPLSWFILCQSHKMGTVFLLTEAEPTMMYSVLASQISWMAFTSLMTPLIFLCLVITALVSFWGHIWNPSSLPLDPFNAEQPTLYTFS